MDAETREYLEQLFARHEANLRREFHALLQEIRDMRADMSDERMKARATREQFDDLSQNLPSPLRTEDVWISALETRVGEVELRLADLEEHNPPSAA
jgi:predicted  nucleic acid-binding Zn-ribbon protein